jgi:glutathione peroxidase-family protein
MPNEVSAPAGALSSIAHTWLQTDVNGSNEAPVWTFMKQSMPVLPLMPKNVGWNFSKVIIAKDGSVASWHPSTTSPSQLAAEIEKLL